MSLPTNITKDHLLSAIDKMDNEGIPSGGDSKSYDVLYNGRRYPPKLIVAYANIFANGHELDRNTFEGGLDTPCFKLLERAGFEIVLKTKTDAMKEHVWIHEIKSGEESQINARILYSHDKKYFYWDDKNYRSEKLGGFVYLINPTGRWALFCKFSERDIKPNFDRGKKKSSFRHFGKDYEIDDPRRRYTSFVRLDVLQQVEIPGDWRWQVALGSPEKLNLVKDTPPNWEKVMPRFNDLKRIFTDGEGRELLDTIEATWNAISPFPKVWFVAQGSTFTENRGMKYLWAPVKDKQGNNHFYWDNVKAVKKGDIIFNYSKGLQAVSIARTDGYNHENDDPNSEWDAEGYRVDIEITALEPMVLGEEIANSQKELERLLELIKNRPFTKDGKVNQGYLYEFTKEAGKYIRDHLYRKPFGNRYIDDFFDDVVVPTKTTSGAVDYNHVFRREIAAIKTKPFLLMAGISGTGKSRMVRTLAYKTCPEKLRTDHEPRNFKNISVRPNWHDSGDLLGYVTRINGNAYHVTEFIQFVLKAWHNTDTPFFLCLDEMNLAPVEQYFAEYLSKIESRRKTETQIITDTLISAEQVSTYKKDFRPYVQDDELMGEFLRNGIGIPSNLIVIGTVNMDETTHSFSRKVLDRAMTFEKNIDTPDGRLPLPGNTDSDWTYENSFPREWLLTTVLKPSSIVDEFSEATKVVEYINKVNKVLEGTSFMVAYRTLDEAIIYMYHTSLCEGKPDDWFDQAFDDVLLMKVLPRIEGDENSVASPLKELITEFSRHTRFQAKAKQMQTRLEKTGYTSFWS